LIKNQRRNRNTRRRINAKDESEKHEYEKNKIGHGKPTPRIYREIFEKMKKRERHMRGQADTCMLIPNKER